MKILIRSFKYPIPQYGETLADLVDAVQLRDFNFEEMLDELEAVNFKIDEQPEEALAEFLDLYARVQAYQSRVTSILVQMHREHGVWKRFKNRADSLYRRAKDRILSTNPEIQALRNKELQESAVHELIPDLVNIREIIDNVIDDIESMKDIAEEKKEDLDKANTNLSRQQKIVESLINLNYPVNPNRRSKQQ